MTAFKKPITESGFLKEPIGEEYVNYARYVIGSLIKTVELKWNPGRQGMSLDEFVLETAADAILQAKKDYAKGLFRKEEGSFKGFFYWRIKKAFFEKLNELKENPNKSVFDERLGKCYEEQAVEFSPIEGDDNDVIHFFYTFSPEKEKIIEENYKIKLLFAQKIRKAVDELTPNDQRLFYLKFKMNLSDEDYKMWETIKSGKHVKDPFTRMANQKFGISENYAKKRISEIKSFLIELLNKSSVTQSSYRQSTSMPGMLQSLFATRPRPQFHLDIEDLSEDDCHDILVELFF